MNQLAFNKALEFYVEDATSQEKASLEFFKQVFTVYKEIEELVAAQSNYELPSLAEVQSLYWSDTNIFKKFPVPISEDLFVEALQKIATLYANSGLLPEEEGRALLGYDWNTFVNTANLALAGSSTVEFFDDCIDRYEAFEVDPEIDPLTFLSVPRLTLRPFLSKASHDVLTDFVKTVTIHQQAQPHTCPTCGGPISSSAVAGPQGSSTFKGRNAYCSLCGAQWPIERIVCTSCGTTQPNKLHYYHEADDPAHRLQTCDLCGNYGRVVFQIDLKAPFSMEIEDLILSKLDGMIAQLEAEKAEKEAEKAAKKDADKNGA